LKLDLIKALLCLLFYLTISLEILLYYRIWTTALGSWPVDLAINNGK